MKDESFLLKEFKDSDVSRIRNLIKKDFGAKTKVQVGYQKAQEHKEGEEFEEGGKTYVIKNGIKIKLTKLDEIRKMAHIPLICPNCKKAMNKSVDKRVYPLHKFCFNCLIEHDTKLVIEGKYTEYTENILKKDRDEFIKDLEQEYKEYLSEGEESFVTEEGVIEDWVGGKENALQEKYEELLSNLKKKNESE